MSSHKQPSVFVPIDSCINIIHLAAGCNPSPCQLNKVLRALWFGQGKSVQDVVKKMMRHNQGVYPSLPRLLPSILNSCQQLAIWLF